jgi:transcriptional regulator with XRE-family HTH domain
MSTVSKKIEQSKKQLGINLKKIREAQNMSQFDLATVINELCSESSIEKTTISRIENGRTNVTLATLTKLSLALEIDIKKLFDFEL